MARLFLKEVNKVSHFLQYPINVTLVEWYEQHELQYVNIYMRYKRRNTWWHTRHAWWYELDGFIVKKSGRQRMVRRM